MRDADPGKRRQRKRKIGVCRSLVVNSGCENRWYLATMLPYDEECHRRIARHRQMRAKKGFETLEVPYALQQLELTEPMQSGCALLECMSNLVANELFCPQGSGEQTEEAILRGVERLVSGCAQVVIVTNELFSDGMQYDPSTEHYLRILGRINCRLAQMADPGVRGGRRHCHPMERGKTGMKIRTLLESLDVAFSMYSAIPMPQIEWNEPKHEIYDGIFPDGRGGAGCAALGFSLLAQALGLGFVLFAAVAALLPLFVTGRHPPGWLL